MRNMVSGLCLFFAGVDSSGAACLAREWFLHVSKIRAVSFQLSQLAKGLAARIVQLPNGESAACKIRLKSCCVAFRQSSGWICALINPGKIFGLHKFAKDSLVT